MPWTDAAGAKTRIDTPAFTAPSHPLVDERAAGPRRAVAWPATILATDPYDDEPLIVVTVTGPPALADLDEPLVRYPGITEDGRVVILLYPRSGAQSVSAEVRMQGSARVYVHRSDLIEPT
jgi:hypothetical protein